MKPAIVILYIWMALLTWWTVGAYKYPPRHIDAKHQAAGDWMKANSENIESIQKYINKYPGHTHQ